ncbi:aspartate-semialdehyde dehydrogenase [Blattabacterium cuenoti]|uniref:aspartate-semialdehyde dehydrogenase n=1 Tax=Blattabacterium cuenoti TaxID=1653831 RepID=UPI00163BF967|nr:aspartate-semialdehyde dehydrogenase [Blattabacterium cuenoti]
MILGIVGATGLVGRIILKILEEKKFPIKKLYISASDRSVGKKLLFNNKNHTIIKIHDLFLKKPNLVLFSAGSAISKKWALKFSNIGSIIIDNSSAWRMDHDKKLIVPEINAHLLNKNDRIIANPNCSTIQLVMVLFPLHIKYNIKRVIISTYQSVTGTGRKALDQLENEKKGNLNYKKVYPYPIYNNVLPHCDEFSENGYTIEEIKLMQETKKIMNDKKISVTATSVRVPVTGGHSESVNITFKDNPNINVIRKILFESEGIILFDDPYRNIYPMPLYAQGKDEVFVGRIRKDLHFPNSINLWIVSDNLRKGAATNAVQIAEYLISKNYI